MIVCNKVEHIFCLGATYPLLMVSESGEKWVVKGLGNPQGDKAVFNEFVAAHLALWLGLPWPESQIVRIGREAFRSIESDAYAIKSEIAIGLKYVSSLVDIEWPKGGYNPAATFPRRNLQHILNLFPDKKTWTSFYGKVIFDNWLLLQDKKYDTLKKRSTEPFFLDGTMALNGLDWNEHELEWVPHRISIASPYLYGVISSSKEFKPWLNKLIHFPEDCGPLAFDQLPDEWNVPCSYIARLISMFSDTSQIFVPMVNEWVEKNKYSGDLS